MGSNGHKNQVVICCTYVSIDRFNDPENKTTGKMMRLIATSYEIICAADRSAPMKAYFELLDQPARIILYTPRELRARRNRMP
jgi:hypothetical protein